MPNMSIFLRGFSGIFKSKLAFAFLFANLFICGFALNWNKVFSYVNEHEKKHHRAISTVSSSKQIGFSACHYSRQISSDEVLMSIFTLISFPAKIGAEIFITDLKKNHPDWCVETFEVFEMFVLVIFNSLFLFLLGVFIEQFYEKYSAKPPPKERILNL